MEKFKNYILDNKEELKVGGGIFFGAVVLYGLLLASTFCLFSF